MNLRLRHAALFSAFAFLALASSKAPDGKTEDKPATSAAAKADDKAKPADAPAASASAAAGDAEDKPIGHCMTKSGLCTETLFPTDTEKADCDGQSGTYEKDTPCPTKDTLIGTCLFTGDLLGAPLPIQKIYFYSDDGLHGLADAKEACNKDVLGGGAEAIKLTWKDGPGASKAAAATKPAKVAPVKVATPKKK